MAWHVSWRNRSPSTEYLMARQNGCFYDYDCMGNNCAGRSPLDDGNEDDDAHNGNADDDADVDGGQEHDGAESDGDGAAMATMKTR